MASARKPPPMILLPIALVCLIILAVVLGKEWVATTLSETGPSIASSLHQKVSAFLSSSSSNLDTVLEDSLTNVKGAATEQVNSTRDTILKSVEQEVAEFSQEQVRSLKTQICTSWGVYPEKSNASDSSQISTDLPESE